MGVKKRVYQVIMWSSFMVIYGYKNIISPYLTKACIHKITCSSFAIKLLRRRGVTAWGKIVIRIIRCNPYHRKVRYI